MLHLPTLNHSFLLYLYTSRAMLKPHLPLPYLPVSFAMQLYLQRLAFALLEPSYLR